MIQNTCLIMQLAVEPRAVLLCSANETKKKIQICSLMFIMGQFGDYKVAYHELQHSSGSPKQAPIDCTSIIFGTIWKNEHNFCTFCKSITARIISIFKKIFAGNITRVMTCLDCKIDYFQVLSMVQSFFNNFEMFWEDWGEGQHSTASFCLAGQKQKCSPLISVCAKTTKTLKNQRVLQCSNK